METKKINNKVVKAIPIDESKKDKRPIKGADICPECFANVLCLARKGSGKTSIIYHLLQQCLGRDSSVIAFVSTLEKDIQWTVIREYCESKGVPFRGYTSLMDNDVNMLEALINYLQEPPPQTKAETAPEVMTFSCAPADPPPEAKHVKKLRKTTYQAPEYIIILDDLSDELKVKSVSALLKKNRHFKAKVIISTQWLNDLPPDGFKQINLLMLFKGFSTLKLQEIHAKSALPISYELFEEMYNQATTPEYGFLWVDLDRHTFRMNFTDQFVLSE